MTAEISRAHNPLRDPDDRRLNRIAGPSALVIFGVTGDLSRKKLMPAVYDLANRGLLPPGFALVGFARRDWEDQDFAQVVHDAVRAHARTPFREETWKQLLQGIRFVSGEFGDADAFARLRATVEELDRDRGTMGNHAFYLSIPPKDFPIVAKQLKDSGLVGEDGDGDCWRRVVIEKPFGHDLQSARELNAATSSRTTCSSCWPSPRWKSPSRWMPRTCAPRRRRSSPPSGCPRTCRRRRRAGSTPAAGRAARR